MDFEDGIYLFASVLIGCGAGLLSPGAGLICFGCMLAVPPMLSMLRGAPRQKKDGDKWDSSDRN